VVALRFVTVQLLQLLQDHAVLDALGHHRRPQVVRQVDGRAHDLRVALFPLHRHHEALVDLQLVHRQPAQAGQR
jgi:hypothetical protein